MIIQDDFSLLAALLNQQCHKQKSILALDGCKIGSAGEDGKISEMCPNVVELDISSNLLHSWEQVCLSFYCELPEYIEGR